MTGYEDCARQRNLTERGRDEARAIGAAIAPPAHSDRRCAGESVLPHARDRAARSSVGPRPTPAVRGGPAPTDGPERYRRVAHAAVDAAARGHRLAIASHGNPFHAVAGPPYLAEGEAAVIQPLGGEGFA